VSLSKIKSLVKDSLIYGIAGIISRMITVFLVPVYTRIFQPSDYGIIALINTTFFIVSLLSVCALDSSAARWYYDTDEELDRKRTFASWFWFQLGFSVLLAALMFSSIQFFSRFVLRTSLKEVLWIWLLPCATLITNVLPNIIWNWYRLNRRPKATIVYTLSQSLLTIALTILFVVVLKWGVVGVYAALFLSSFLFSVIALFALAGWIHFRFFSKIRLKEMLRFSLPLVPAAIAFWLINSTDAYFIQYFKNPKEVGLFAVGASLASGVSLFTGAFQQAWGPFAFSIMNEPDAKKTYATVFLIFGVVSSAILLGMFLFSPEILILLTTSKYYDAAWVASILSINIILISFTYIASIGSSIAKNNKYYSIGILIASVLTVLLDILLIPKWGKEGSAIATVVAQLIVPIYLFYKADKLYPVPYRFGAVTLLLSCSVALGIVGRIFTFQNSLNELVTKGVIFLVFVSFITLVLRQQVQNLFFRFNLNKRIVHYAENAQKKNS
jgi:O-antigen/teichoic acid export membrane protein